MWEERVRRGSDERCPVPPPSLLARARAHAVGLRMHRVRIRRGPSPCPRRCTHAHVHAQAPSATRGTRAPPHPTRGGRACAYPCHGGASGDERRDISGRVQLDSAPAGYSEDTDTDTVSGSYCCWCMCGCSSCTVEAPPGWDSGDVALQETATVAKADYPRAGGTRHVIQVAVLCLPPPEI
ncbi:hypothetical protein B0H14DRAFT_3165182 [Mycena olivaceomarginata]|nr:hypothetical protein B0H14DRAFT_3165182 [Mycena olivaceomarginata]